MMAANSYSCDHHLDSWNLPRVIRIALGLAVLACSTAPLGCGSTVIPTSGARKVERVKFLSGGASVVVELLDDDLMHFELSAVGGGPDTGAPLYTTPMVLRTDYAGPSRFTNNGAGGLEAAALRLAGDDTPLCMTVTDMTRRPAAALTTICPSALGNAAQALTIAPNGTHHVYGLGEHFLTPGVANGDWIGQAVQPGDPAGNAITPFNGGDTGNAQFPVMYALGAAGQNYALFLDHLYAQAWDFTGDPWKVSTGGAQIRGYVLGGADLAALRSHYMDLVGRPLVPPRKMFGLWVSEFGYR